MSSKPIIILLLILLQTLFSCQSDNSKTNSVLPVIGHKVFDHSFDAMLQALHLLQNDPLLQNASLGYLIVDVTTKDPVIVADYHSKQLMMPASTLKIFVTAAALEFFGKPVFPEVTITNQMSVNWRSSKLLRKIGGKVYNKATTESGVQAILDFWQTKGVDTEGMNFYDGNGLSRNNAISPKQLVDALYAMRASPYFEVFLESLPLAGLTGTLHRAMKGSAAVGRIRAKTGTINNVKSFAGYINTVTGRKLVFSLIVNNFDCRVKLMKKKLESVMIRMAEV
ncbi:MAG: D-alanyl-D-alanine carboxypeptidase/D-alanyl-D-alanine-endopeptidase [Bacteroidetes bacterium]|nr:D-alanyl-D-alanine carboxypeptidase/D-alanyl-D-alanine-endopeptidase [Bacteroidota bacterium]